MICWNVHRYERHVLGAINNVILSCNHLTASRLHTYHTLKSNVENNGKENQPNVKDAKLNMFVHRIRLRNARLPKFYRDPQTPQHSVKPAAVKKHMSINQPYLAESHVNSVRMKEPSIPKYVLSKTEYIKKVSSPKSQQNISIKVKDSKKYDGITIDNVVISSNTLMNDNRLKNNNTKPLSVIKEVSLENIEEKVSNSFSNSQDVSLYNKQTENQVPIVDTKKATSSPKRKNIQLVQVSVKLTKPEQLALTNLMDSGEEVEALSKVEVFIRQNRKVPFGILRRLCGWACTSGLVDEVLRLKQLAEKGHPHMYKKQFCLDNYLASALCYSGDFSGSLDKLLSLYLKYPKGSKKIKDAAVHIIFHIMETCNEENEQMVLNFVMHLAEEQDVLSPALGLWRIGFCSTLYRQQKIAETLLESYPKLIKLLPQKLDNIIHIASRDADIELLQRIFELLLLHQLSDFYADATAALLQHQCNIGDMAGADETIKFATALRVHLKPSEIQRFLILLHYHKHPVPLSVLEMKYRLPPKPSIRPPSEFRYKF